MYIFYFFTDRKFVCVKATTLVRAWNTLKIQSPTTIFKYQGRKVFF